MATPNLIDWETIKAICNYPDEDNNAGFVFGIEWSDEEGQLIDMQWFKTDEEREASLADTLQHPSLQDAKEEFFALRRDDVVFAAAYSEDEFMQWVRDHSMLNLF